MTNCPDLTWLCDGLSTFQKLIKIAQKRSISKNLNNIGYIGWVGQGNLGDDAMYSAARKLLAPAELIHFDGRKREQLFTLLGLSGHRYFSSVFLGGGTLINPGYKNIVQLALSSGLDVSSLGTGVGSSGFSAKRFEEIEDWIPLLHRFKHLGVRGPRSLKILQEMGVEHAEVVGDLALALAPDESFPYLNSCFYALNIATPSFNSPSFPTSKLFSGFIKTVSELYQKGLHPLPIAFCPDDIDPLSYILDNSIPSKIDVRLIRSHEELFGILKSCRFLLGVRLHSAVLSCCVGVPPILVGYRDKCADFMESMDLIDWHIDAYSMKSGELSSLVKRLIDSKENDLRMSIHMRACLWRKRLREYIGIEK